MKRFWEVLLVLGLIFALGGCAGSRAFQRGEGFAREGKWDDAVSEYRQALKSDPQDIEYRSALLRAEETAANEHYKRARNFLKERKLDQAILELQQAVYLNPTNAAIQSALKSVLNMKQAEEHYRAALTFVELNRLSEAIGELNRAVELDPENIKYQDSLDKLQKKKSEAEPEEALTLASDKPITLNFKNTNIKEVFELLSKLSGINIMFDEEVRAQPVTIFVKDVSFQYALNLLLSTNKLFMKKISADTIIIVPKTKAKIDQYQDLMMKTFYLTNAKAKDAVNLLRTMLDTRKVYVNEVLNSITVRDSPEKLKLVEKVLAANDLKEAEVILDVEILEIARNKSLQYGWNFQPGLFAAATIVGNQSQVSTNTTQGTVGVSTGITLEEFKNLTRGNIMLTLPSVVATLIKQDMDAQTLANPRVRVLNNKTAKFHIGDKIPIQTSTVQSTATVAVTSTFEYKDIGIKLNVEPTVHLSNTVTLKMSLEVSNLGNLIDFGNGQKQYSFGTRNTDTTVNLRDGETVIIGGLIKDEERKTANKIPILGDIPILGKLFASSDDETVKTDILMSITPNIVRPLELPSKEDQSFWSGTEESFDVKPLFVAGSAKMSHPQEKQDKTAVLEALAKRGPQPATAAETAGAPKPAVAAPSVAMVPAAVLELRPSTMETSVGQDVQFDMAVENIKGLYGAIITINYDPKTVDFKTAVEGQLLRKDGQQTSFLFSNNIKAGTVDIYLTRIGDVGNIDGSGSLGTIVFQAKTAGRSPVQFKSVKLGNYSRETLRAELRSATVTVK
jgi:general secretion pathway protein D